MTKTATKTENTTQVIKLASIDNGKFIFNKTNRKPFEVIANRANRIVTSINTIDNKSNLLRSQKEYDLFIADNELMQSDFNVYTKASTTTNKNTTSNKKASVKSVPTKMQSDLRKTFCNKETLAYLEQYGSYIRAIGNLIKYNDAKKVNEMVKVNGLSYADKTKSFSLLSNGHVVNYKTVYTYCGIKVDHKNENATVNKTNGHIQKKSANEKKSNAKKSDDNTLSLDALSKLTLDQLREKAIDIFA
ncbi:MAG: hypothetical protein CMC63_08160, partial [Flavobacteriaceae bacterium]|nr:hypothetical protein [Flavobacteriaceae bacterium]